MLTSASKAILSISLDNPGCRMPSLTYRITNPASASARRPNLCAYHERLIPIGESAGNLFFRSMPQYRPKENLVASASNFGLGILFSIPAH